MSKSKYITAILKNLGVYYTNTIDASFFETPESLLTSIALEEYNIVVLGKELKYLESGSVKEGYGHGTAFVIFSLGEYLLRIDYNYSSWDDPTFDDDCLYFVERRLEKVVSEKITYIRK